MIGFINLYKPQGMTSFDAVRRLKREVKPDKIGHLGTLDPMAEGILPLAIGNGTRLIEYIADKKKTYRASMVLGGISDTQDQWGQITPVAASATYSIAEIKKVLCHFHGEIEQIPPMYSAVHYNGQRLYELARKGIEVERKPRKVQIYQLELLEVGCTLQNEQCIAFRVECSEGTYIRTLCHDIGQCLGSGGYMNALVRERWGAFTLENAVSLEEAAQNWRDYLIDPREVLASLPHWTIPNEEQAQSIWFGNALPLPENFPEAEPVLLLKPDGTIAAVGGKKQGRNQQWEICPYKVLK